jgi:hypothetical protein
MAAIDQPPADADVAAERWRNAIAHLEYAERHTTPAVEVERLANEVIEARVAMFQSGVQGAWALPAFVQSALDRDQELLEIAAGSREQAASPRIGSPRVPLSP